MGTDLKKGLDSWEDGGGGGGGGVSNTSIPYDPKIRRGTGDLHRFTKRVRSGPW